MLAEHDGWKFVRKITVYKVSLFVIIIHFISVLNELVLEKKKKVRLCIVIYM